MQASTVKEARNSSRIHEYELVILVKNLLYKLNVKNVISKLEKYALYIQATDRQWIDWVTDRVRALNKCTQRSRGCGGFVADYQCIDLGKRWQHFGGRVPGFISGSSSSRSSG